MVDSAIRGVLGSFHGSLPGKVVDARRRDWKQWRTHGSRSVAY